MLPYFRQVKMNYLKVQCHQASSAGGFQSQWHPDSTQMTLAPPASATWHCKVRGCICTITHITQVWDALSQTDTWVDTPQLRLKLSVVWAWSGACILRSWIYFFNPQHGTVTKNKSSAVVFWVMSHQYQRYQDEVTSSIKKAESIRKERSRNCTNNKLIYFIQDYYK